MNFHDKLIVRITQLNKFVFSLNSFIVCFAFAVHQRMEFRLVLNCLTDINITNQDMCGYLHQHLRFYKFRRIPTKSTKSMFYLFFQSEQESYYALRAARSIKTISLVRYRPSKPISFEPSFKPFAPQRIINIPRFAFANKFDKFDSKVR